MIKGIRMEVILIRYAELGLKSERVRARFLSRLVEDINRNLSDHGIEHFIRTERGRIFLETGEKEKAIKHLPDIPGIHSFSLSEEVPSDIDGLMKGLSSYSSSRLIEGMTFGIKVRKSIEMDLSSRDIAILAGDAVCSHLDENSVKVDLKNPDLWFEVEIRRDHSYIFDNRKEGMGGMPSSTQGKVILYLPPRGSLNGDMEETGMRTLLSRKMMIRRGCRVIPAVKESDLDGWNDLLDEIKENGKDPFILTRGDVLASLEEAIKKTDSSGLIHPGTLCDLSTLPLLHGYGIPVSVFQPTAGMDEEEVRLWMDRFERNQ
jgi:thiamine biosynthesis protein ThiI